MSTDSKSDERLKFIRFLYRNESAFSDHVSLARLKELNIRTKLEEVVRKIVRAGGSVVITGNAAGISVRGHPGAGSPVGRAGHRVDAGARTGAPLATPAG